MNLSFFVEGFNIQIVTAWFQENGPVLAPVIKYFNFCMLLSEMESYQDIPWHLLC